MTKGDESEKDKNATAPPVAEVPPTLESVKTLWKL